MPNNNKNHKERQGEGESFHFFHTLCDNFSTSGKTHFHTNTPIDERQYLPGALNEIRCKTQTIKHFVQIITRKFYSPGVVCYILRVIEKDFFE